MNRLVVMLVLAALAVCSGPVQAESSDLEAELRAVETAFAQTMADRDLDGFRAFLADEVVFDTGGARLVGPVAVAEAWAPYFQGDDPLFSWEPEVVAVLESGTLGLSSGPVLDPAGERIGTFNSVWRRADDGRWTIVFDRGCPACE